MKSSLFILISIIALSISADKLVFVLTHFRHGARAPQYYYDQENHLDYILEKWERPGELTAMGQRMHYLLGLRNRERYINNTHFLSEKFDPHEILIYSSQFNRTLLSAESQLQGLYPQYLYLGEILNDEQIEKAKPQVNLSDDIIEQMNKLGEKALPNCMTVAPVRMITHSEKKIILYDIPKCLFRRDEYRDINYKNLDTMKNKVKEFNDKFKSYLKDIYVNINDFNISFIDNFCDAFIAGYTEGKNMTKINQTGVNKLELLEYCYEFFKFGFRDWIHGNKERTLATLEVSKLMKEFIYYMKKRVDADIIEEDISKELEDYSRPKMMMISAHDSTISAYEMFLAKVFNNNDANNFYKYPKFATQIAFEVVTDDSIDSKNKKYSDYRIKYYFNDQFIFEKKMDEFIKNVEANLWSDEKIDEFCGFVDEKEENTDLYFYLMIIFSSLSVIFLIIIIILLIKSSRNKNRISIIKEGVFLENSEAKE